MNLSAMPRWARWATLSVVGVGMLSVVAIPFVDATRLAPAAVAEGRSYDYTLELVGDDGLLGRVEVGVDHGSAPEVSVRSCLSGVDCRGLAEPFVPYERLVDTVGGREWSTVTPPPLLEARAADPVGPVRIVRVVAYDEGRRRP